MTVGELQQLLRGVRQDLPVITADGLSVTVTVMREGPFQLPAVIISDAETPRDCGTCGHPLGSNPIY